ncbi:uncharacterized protein LOC125903418 isoform X2 [Epinephelus fuscoguttatus]|uniref:uncharacterized protein LOC125903418 isoform X2 n=1 Tax=Epinephelus fuscoguttatus TaxID=293821 RepID=UPI0020D08B92|nr:uncharacterized protein LOC125903418 isoform X2 [Epinephelus fuscoguttatus]
MSSLLDHGLIRTAAVEQVVAPIASHLCHMVLLCDTAEEPEQFSQLEAAAQAVAKATANMAAVASRQIRDTEDEVLHMEMSSLLESVTVSGQHVLLAAQKLSIQPSLTEHREELITATQNVFLGVVKVLLVDDDATVRRVVAAADRVLECLSELGSASDIKSLLKSFQVFSEALLLLNSLTVDRANSLQDPRQTKQLLDSLETLRRCISMLQTAMCTTIKHPTSEQAQAARRYILDKVQSTAVERDSQTEHEEENTDEETIEAELAHKYDSDDLKIPAVYDKPKLIRKPLEFDLLPLMYEVVTVTKGKDVTVLNRACTAVLELSNCYAQAAKEASAIVDAVDCQTLECFKAELVSLTPLLVQTAQETAMSSAMSTESIYKHSTQFTDLINNTRKVLLPVAGTWYHTVYTELQGNLPTKAATVTQQLNEVMTLGADVVQLLTSSDLASQSDSQETFSVLHNKLNKAQNNTKYLVEFVTSVEGQADQLEGLCILWGLSIQILLNSLDKILGTSTAMNQLSPQKHLSVLSENSLRIQEAARLTSLNCKSAYKSKQLTGHQDELKTLTDAYLKAAEELDTTPSVMQLAKSEFFQRHLLIKIKVLSSHLSKANKDFDKALQNIVSIAYFAAEHFRENNTEDAEQKFENAAQTLSENVKQATKRVEDCLHYVRDPRSRSNLRSINDHLSFQISDIISRARLIVETHYICDTLSLDVQIQCWSAKAHYVVEEIRKQDGIHQEAKEYIRAGLQGRAPDDIKDALATIPLKVKEVEFPSDMTMTSWQKGNTENVEAAEPDVNVAAVAKYEPGNMEKDDSVWSGTFKESPSLTHTSLFLKQESDSWDPKDNRIVQVTRKMADTLCYMTQYLKKKGPIPNKEAFVSAAKDVISNCQSVTQFIRVIANHCLDKQCTVELSLIVEQILTITNQLNIISSVNAVTPGCKSSDEILVKNTQNLLQTVLRGVHAAETACITGLKQPEPNSDGEEATALCFQWRRKLEIHRAQQTSNLETDELGLRKTSSHPVAPSLAPPVDYK